jgi:uncharacterized membrane protein YkvA (DUF1232 family)
MTWGGAGGEAGTAQIVKVNNMAKRKNDVPRDPDLLARFMDNLMLSLRLLTDNRVGMAVKLIPAAVLLYILSPIDIIPDFLLPFGVADDLTALLLGLQLFIRSAPPDVVAEYRRRKQRDPEIEDEIAQLRERRNTIEGQYSVREDDEG